MVLLEEEVKKKKGTGTNRLLYLVLRNRAEPLGAELNNIYAEQTSLLIKRESCSIIDFDQLDLLDQLSLFD